MDISVGGDKVQKIEKNYLRQFEIIKLHDSIRSFDKI